MKRIKTGIIWGVSSYLIFIVTALIFVIFSGGKISTENIFIAMKFALYGGIAGVIYGYVEQEKREEVSTQTRGKVSVIQQKERGGVSAFVKTAESIFSLIKIFLFFAVIAAIFYLYMKYFRK